MTFRPVFSENSNVTLQDALSCDLELLLKINEFLDIRDSLLEIRLKDQEEEIKRQAQYG